MALEIKTETQVAHPRGRQEARGLSWRKVGAKARCKMTSNPGGAGGTWEPGGAAGMMVSGGAEGMKGT